VMSTGIGCKQWKLSAIPDDPGRRNTQPPAPVSESISSTRQARGSMFEAIGLNKCTEAVYRAIVANPGWSRQDVARYLSLTKSAVKTAVADLPQQGPPDHPDPDRLPPASPEAGLALLLAKAEQDLDHRRSQVESARAAISALVATHSSTSGERHQVR